METILVRGIAYSPDDPRYPKHSSKPKGPLVPIPGTVVPISMGGDGGVQAAGSQRYIGHSRVAIERDPKDGKIPLDPVNDLGDVLVQMDYPAQGGIVKPVVRPITYRWEFDPSPVLVRRTPEIIRALRRGEIEAVETIAAPEPEPEKTSKRGKRGGD